MDSSVKTRFPDEAAKHLKNHPVLRNLLLGCRRKPIQSDYVIRYNLSV